MEINKDNIELFITNQGLIIGERQRAFSEVVRLINPLLLIKNNSGIYLTDLFMGEQWIIIPHSYCMQISVNETIKDEYIKEVEKNNSSIILPNADKRIIL
jgi:hypothetical protein